MPSFYNLNDRRGSKVLMVTSIQDSDIERMTERNPGKSFTVLCQTLSLFIALAVGPTVVFAQEWGHDRDADHERHSNDPTGAWLIRSSKGLFILTVFHKGGTLTGDVQGESAFIPGPQPPSNVITSPESGVWQKTGAKTFAATFVAIEYQVNPHDSTLYELDKVQFTGALNESGDEMKLTALVTLFNPDGSQKGDSFPDTANGIRIPLELLPSTTHSLRIPQQPQ
jgi:hypothetical protein